MGRSASVEEGRLSACAVSGLPGLPATMMTPPLSMLTNGWSCLNASIIRCCLRNLGQFSPFLQLCRFGIICSMPTIDTDSNGEMMSS